MAEGQEAQAGKVVMVIDDARTIRDAAESFLKPAGHRVVLAENGWDALAKIWDERPDLIFVDVNMPRLDGYETCQLIKQNEELGDIPLVMLSAQDGIFDKAKGLLSGATEYLVKPFSRATLLDAVKRHAR
jgi:twitching motility two-component system response regulator PilG